MKRIFLFLWLLPIWACADWDSLFSETEDPSLFHHVNVITGNLNLFFQDAVVMGARPIPIQRTYSSSGALERSPQNFDLHLKGLRRGWMVQGGWSLFPHANLLIEPSSDRMKFKAYLSEPTGNLIAYSYSHKKPGTKHTIFLRPTRAFSQSTGKLSQRTNPQNNLLEIDLKAGVSVLFLPNGGSRTYRGPSLHHFPTKWDQFGQFFYLLETEKLPSQHFFRYCYDKNTTDLVKITSNNPAGDKIYASIDVQYISSTRYRPSQIRFKNSDGKQLFYPSIRHEDRNYICELQGNCCPKERYHLLPGRKGIGVRLSSIDIGGKEPFNVHYYLPANKEQERKWAEKPEQKEFHIDKVKSIVAPVGPKGENVQVAHFTYYPNRTDVRDAEGLLIRYTHDSERLNSIEYFDEKDQLRSSQRFYWEGTHLCCKAMFDNSQRPLFAKTFRYEDGNVVEEVIWGSITGNDITLLQIDSEGKPIGAENYRKTYTYYKDNLLKTESEEEGPTYEYFYKPGTDLCTEKLTKGKEGKIFVREFSSYDDDNLLIHEIIDDGVSLDPENKSEVTQRLEKRCERNAAGLPEYTIESYWDPVTQTVKLLKKTKYTYLNQRIHTEEIFDASGTSRYTMTTEYDDWGNIKRKTTPLGRENLYRYNTQGYFEESKEVGSPKKIFHYDKANRPVSCEETDAGKISTTGYDAKGRILFQTDGRGNETIHTYDFFGNRRKTELPASKDELGHTYRPTPKFDYDLQGNLILTEMPLKEMTRTSYNLFRKPTSIIQADGTQIHHFYNRNGTLAKTLYPDKTEVHYGYDLFKRMTSKTVYSKDQKALLSESWEYSSFQLRSHTDARGLKIKFGYDGAGRKSIEKAEDQKTTFSYDLLGFLEKTDNGFVAFVQKHNVEGLIEEQWEEDPLGRIENQMKFFYDKENRKEKAIRTTSQGEAIDIFSYKEGKLSSHIDPNGYVTKFIYDEFFENELGQKVLQKTTIDPLGNATIETYDAGERLVLREKKDPQGISVFKEELLYDRSGNQAKRISHSKKDHSITWKYDEMGRVKKETESQQKTTSYDYDSKGRLEWKTLPNGIRLHYSYDDADRLEELKSSDGKIHYRYVYVQGPDPAQISDLIQGALLKRRYNRFGQIISETDCRGFTKSWDYDATGRCISFTLPDGSSIQYSMQGSHMIAVQRKNSRGDLLYEHRYRQFDPNSHVSEEDLILNLGTIQTSHDLLERPSNQKGAYMEQSISYGPSGLVMHTENSLFGEKRYDYDALNQLKEDEGQIYQFDSLGNPTQFEVNDLNQITTIPECSLTYDENGNPRERISTDGIMRYEFDPLGRLVEITIPQKRKVSYSYDPLSRLFVKEIYRYRENSWQKEQKVFYLYDQEREIGTQDESGHLIELKVLGLGVRGDIGAAVALEIGEVVYAPLHDFNGNIVALFSPGGDLVEKYEIDAFGKEKTSSSFNPWRFYSKRCEEGLVFFGVRFYDPALGRWLTPDPAGFADGANLYVFVQNSPGNRLDLFGLVAEDPFAPFGPIEIAVPIWRIPMNNDLFDVRMWENGIYVDYFISCGHWHELRLTPHEERTGSFNLFDHSELYSAGNGEIGLVTFTHGINVKMFEFDDACESIVKRHPSGTLFIGRYYGTDGLPKDLGEAGKEYLGIETREVCQERQFLITCSQALHKVNPAVFDDVGKVVLGALWSHYDHSRGGLIDLRALQGMPYEQQKILQTQLLLTSIAPAGPIPNEFGLRVRNYFSNQDFATGIFGASDSLASVFFGVAGSLLVNHSDCDVMFVPCTSTRNERTFGADHGILGGTYQGVIDRSSRDNNRDYGFYGGKNR